MYDRRGGQRVLLLGGMLVLALPALASAQEGGRLVGRVLDGATGQPLVNAQVYSAGPAEGAVGALTSLDGRYVLRNLPPGLHDITVQLLGYGTKVVTALRVDGGRTETLDITLEQQAIPLDAIVVTSAAQRSSTLSLMAERRLAAVVSDAIGSEQISRSPDGDAAAALKRVPGLSVVDGKYAYVRGLGERYSATTLNGAPLASPEPDKKVIPLDVFPTGLLESVVTSKSYSPEQPGDYAGGLIQLRTRDFPVNRILSLRASAGWNSAATFKERLGYSGGALDFLGFDDGTRSLPAAIPRHERVAASSFSTQQLKEMGRAFGGEWGPTPRRLPANGSLAVSFGDELDLGDDRRAGFIGSLSYSSSERVQSDVVERVFSTSGSADPEVDYRGEVAAHSVSLSGLLNTTYQPSRTDQIKLVAVYTHTSNDASRVLSGFNLDSNTDQWNSRSQRVEQSLLNAQLEGKHLLELVRDLEVRWRGGYTRASRYEPSTREALYREFGGRFLWDDFIQSGSVFHQDLVDDGFNGGGSLKLPFELADAPASFAIGGSFERRDRTTYTRRFRFRPQSGGLIDSEVRTLSPNELFGSPGRYIDPAGFQIQEATFRTDNYDALQNIDGVFAMVDLELGGRLRVSGGARVERSLQTVTPRDLWSTGLAPVEGAKLESVDVLPAINTTLALGDAFNLRASASRTLARAQLRELAPFSFADYAGGFLVIGNPALEQTRISNYDLRLEWFRTPTAVVAVSAFHKAFDAPIEVAILPSSELIRTWVNGEGGENHGIELEARSDLALLSPALAAVSINANVTLVESRMKTGGIIDVHLPGTGAQQLALLPRERGLQGQSPYVINVGLTWTASAGGSATMLFNRFGARVDAIGAEALPDIYERARSQLDVAIKWPLSRRWWAELSATRLIGNVVEFAQGDALPRSYDTGRSLSFGLSWAAER